MNPEVAADFSGRKRISFATGEPAQQLLAPRLSPGTPELHDKRGHIGQTYSRSKPSNLTEYTAVAEAMGSAPGFDPQAEAIVHGDPHLLRICRAGSCPTRAYDPELPN